MGQLKFRFFSQVVGLVVAGAAAVGCIYDSADRCGPHMRLSDIATCVCEPGYVLQGASCVACPAHEHESKGACVCDEGLQRPADGAACVAIPKSGLAAPCSGESACEDPLFSYCAAASNGDHYCTSSGCSKSSDCPSGYGCAPSPNGGRYCRRSPLGLGSACMADADCAGNEATFCEPLFSHTCLVQGCSLEQNDCFDGWECCDASSYGMPTPICIPAGKCP